MVISDRLKKIADQIEEGESVADIGTDHAILPIYLIKSGIASKVILTDISPGSAQKAQEQCRRLDPSHEYDIRVGDGLEVLEMAEVDTVVMAGMGGILMSRILEKDPLLSGSFTRYILQPRRHAAYLRMWLDRNGYTVFREHLVEEGKFICNILVAGPPEQGASTRSVPLREEDPEGVYEYPELLLKEDTHLALRYLERERKKLTDILSGISHEHSHRREILQNRIRRIDTLTGGKL